MKNTGSVIVIVQLCPDTETDAPLLAKLLADNIKDSPEIPLNWHVATSHFFEPDSVAGKSALQQIRTRFDEGKDMILPAGYTGAACDLLLEKECLADLTWSVTNPFKSGTMDQATNDGNCFFPFYQENLRNTVEDFCQQTKRILVKTVHNGKKIKALSAAGKIIDVVEGPKNADKVLKTVKSGQNICFYTTINSTNEIKSLASSIEQLAKNLDKTGFSRFDPSLFQSKTVLSDSAEMPSTRRLQIQCIKAAETRHQNTSLPAVMKKLLKNHSIDHNLFPDRKDSMPADFFRLKERQPGAHMGGQIMLAGNYININFDKGRLVQIGDYKLPKPSSAEIFLNKKKHEFKPDTIFSFEGKHSHGMRCQTALKSNAFTLNGQITEDWFFSGDEKQLFVSVTVMHPGYLEDDEINSIHLLNLPLFSWEEGNTENIKAETIYPDGSTGSKEIAAQTGHFVLNGSGFRFTKGSLSIAVHFIQEKEKLVEALTVQIVKHKNRFILGISPRGSLCTEPAEFYSQVLEHFTLGICLNPEGKLALPEFKHAVLDEISSSVFTKTSRTKEEAGLTTR